MRRANRQTAQCGVGKFLKFFFSKILIFIRVKIYSYIIMYTVKKYYTALLIFN